jgi:hypothetical protein
MDFKKKSSESPATPKSRLGLFFDSPVTPNTTNEDSFFSCCEDSSPHHSQVSISKSVINRRFNRLDSSRESNSPSSLDSFASIAITKSATMDFSFSNERRARYFPDEKLINYFTNKSSEWKNYANNLVDSHCHFDMLFYKSVIKKILK